MKFSIGTADLEDIRTAEALGVPDDVTTNPPFMAKEDIAGGVACREHYLKICNIIDGDVSAEMLSIICGKILLEVRELTALHENVVVKVSYTQNGIKTICRLTKEGTRTDYTLIFNLGQVVLAAKAEAICISPFAGHLDDTSSDGISLIADIAETSGTYGFNTQVPAANIHHTRHIIDCVRVGADVTTYPLKAILGLLKHPLTDSDLTALITDQERVAKQGR